MGWEVVKQFENEVATFFGARFGIACDSCTHGLELCLRYTNENTIQSPTRTYVSVPMLADKLGIERVWRDFPWRTFYNITPRIYDAAVLWKAGSYIPNSFMCVSFQFQKHLSLGRGGMILCDDWHAAFVLAKMVYDGREPGVPWRVQNIDTIGYHYYMTPETAALGLEKLPAAIANEPRKWSHGDYPDLREMKIFKKQPE